MNANRYGPAAWASRWWKQARPRGRKRPALGRLNLERLEDRTVPSTLATGYRPVTEVGNNVADPTLGTAGTDLLRLSPAAYADGISSPSLPNDPSARVISDIVNNQADPATWATTSRPSIRTACPTSATPGASSSTTTWTSPRPTRTTSLQILADPNDPSRMGNQTFDRSVSDPTTGTSTSNPAPADHHRHLVPRPVATSTARPRRWPTPCAPSPAAS